MALPPAIRVAALVTMAVFCWLVVQIFRAPGVQKAPGEKAGKFDDMVRDPNLDRM